MALDEVFPKLATGYVPLERRLTEAQLVQLIGHLPPERAAVCAFIAATAADWSSVELAEPEDFDVQRNRAHVRGTKNEHRRREVAVVLPLFRRLLKLAAPHAPFRRWPNAVRDLAVACRTLEIPRVTPRDLRRTHGYILRAHGVEPHLIARSMGHATSTMVERVYGKLPTDAFETLLVARLGTRRAQRKPTKAANGKKKAASR
jgi:integrase